MGEVTGGSLTDGTATLSSGALTGATTVTAIGAVTGGSLTDGTATLSSGALSNATTVTAIGAVTGGSITDGTATLNAGALTGLTTVTANGDVTASNFILVTGGGNLLDLSNNVDVLDTSVTLLDASMAIVEKVASLRYRAVSSSASYHVGAYDNIQSFDTIDISNNMSMIISGLPVNKGKISIPHTGIYSYNLQLRCSTTNVTSIDLAINNNTVNSIISSAGSTGGVNRKYVDGIDFAASSTNTIGLSGISKFNFGDEVQSYIKVSGTGGSVTLDNANESIFSMALLYAID
jgi:hypothetical protein